MKKKDIRVEIVNALEGKREFKNLGFFDELRGIIELYKNGSDEPLDGDEVDRLVKHLKNQINLIEGNITNEEYDKLEC